MYYSYTNMEISWIYLTCYMLMHKLRLVLCLTFFALHVHEDKIQQNIIHKTQVKNTG